MFLRALAATAASLLVSCGTTGLPMPNLAAYRMEIQQGNFVSQEMVSQLKPGMSKEQVRFVMGTPLISDSFHADRWDYVFRRQKANSKELEQRNLAVFFEDGKLKRVDGDVTARAPEPKPEAQPVAVPATPPAADKPAAAPAQ